MNLTYKEVNGWYYVDGDTWRAPLRLPYLTDKRDYDFKGMIAWCMHNFFKVDCSSMTAIDCGANYGYISLGLAKYFNHVYSFEPHRDVFHCLQKNTEGYNITPFNKAVMNKPGNLFYKPQDKLACTMVVESSEDAFPCEAVTIDSYNFKNVGLIKFDCEQNDFKAFQGAINTIRTNRPMIIFEYGNQYFNTRHRDDWYEALESLDYRFLDIGSVDMCWGPN